MVMLMLLMMMLMDNVVDYDNFVVTVVDNGSGDDNDVIGDNDCAFIFNISNNPKQTGRANQTIIFGGGASFGVIKPRSTIRTCR